MTSPTVIPSERSESSVIPSERSESRNRAPTHPCGLGDAEPSIGKIAIPRLRAFGPPLGMTPIGPPLGMTGSHLPHRGSGGFSYLNASSRVVRNCSTSAVNMSSPGEGLLSVHHQATVESGTAMNGDGIANVV